MVEAILIVLCVVLFAFFGWWGWRQNHGQKMPWDKPTPSDRRFLQPTFPVTPTDQPNVAQTPTSLPYSFVDDSGQTCVVDPSVSLTARFLGVLVTFRKKFGMNFETLAAVALKLSGVSKHFEVVTSRQLEEELFKDVIPSARGWFCDPWNTKRLRFFTGSDWSCETTPNTYKNQPRKNLGKQWPLFLVFMYGILLLVILTLLALPVFYFVMFMLGSIKAVGEGNLYGILLPSVVLLILAFLIYNFFTIRTLVKNDKTFGMPAPLK